MNEPVTKCLSQSRDEPASRSVDQLSQLIGFQKFENPILFFRGVKLTHPEDKSDPTEHMRASGPPLQISTW